MLYSASSPAMDCARPMQPLLAAEYAEVLGYPLRPATELVMTMEPPLAWSIMAGMQARTEFQTPLRLMPITSSQVCSGVSHDFLRATTPALATQMSTCPKRLIPSCTAASTCAYSRTSALAATISPPASSTRRTVSSGSAWVASGESSAVGGAASQ